MIDDEPDRGETDPSEVADADEASEIGVIELLQRLGLTEYAARCYVALLQLGSGTAREVSETTSVPRSRVYDAIGRLEERGLVDTNHASPKVFRPVSRETIARHFQLEYDRTVDQLTTQLAAIEPTERQHEQSGVWTVTGQEAVTDRVLELIEEANEQVVYMSVEELLTDEVIATIAAAEDRGAEVYLAGISPQAQQRIQAAIPSAELFETLWEWSETPAGRLLMIDEETILVSVLTAHSAVKETAIWGSGEYNSLVVVLKAIFTWQLNNPGMDTDPG